MSIMSIDHEVPYSSSFLPVSGPIELSVIRELFWVVFYSYSSPVLMFVYRSNHELS